MSYDPQLLTHTCLTSDPRDRIFAILGFFDDDTRIAFSHLGYENTSGDVFRAATEVVYSQSDNIGYLGWRQSTATSNAEPDQPSWVWWLEPTIGFLPGNDVDKLEVFKTGRASEFHGDFMLAWGVIFDTVTSAYPNFSRDNRNTLVLDIHYESPHDLIANLSLDRME